MSLNVGTRLGPYEILSMLGAGGMGEVYKARDTRLERTVAIKVLPSHLSEDSELRQRFEREARTISQISHPNICTLHDIGHENGTMYLVMEYLEGVSLSGRLAKGPLPMQEVLTYGMQIASALDRAHRQGIIHRDLKPQNVIITRSGAKLLDFGLAKFQKNIGPSLSPMASEAVTVDYHLTTKGTILGTLGYMSPEQLEGKEADARSDIFSFGVVLYEMATGHRAFTGDSQASLIASVLTSEPGSLIQVKSDIPPALDRLVRTCLKKDPDNRWQTAHDLMLQLQGIAEGGPGDTVAMQQLPRRRYESLGWILAGVMITILIAAFFLFTGILKDTEVPKEDPLRFAILPPEKTILDAGLAMSPDGKNLAFVASEKGTNLLWLRPLESMEVRPLSGTDDARFPFWSPDSRFIGFFTQQKLKKIELSTGNVLSLCDVQDARGGTWNQSGVILFAPHTLSGIFRVSESGGEPVEALSMTEEEGSQRFPYFLPDGRHFLFVSLDMEDNKSLQIASLDGSIRKEILSPALSAVFTTTGHLMYVQEKMLMARRFDPKKMEFIGDPQILARDLQIPRESDFTGYVDVSVSHNGRIAYRSGSGRQSQLAWFDRNGTRLSVVGPPGGFDEPDLSPDESLLVVNRENPDSRTREVWLVELAGERLSRLTFQQGDGSAVWHPDGKNVAYASRRGFNYDLFLKSAGGVESERLLFESSTSNWPNDFSPDGKHLIFENDDPKTALDLWVLSLEGKEDPKPLIQTRFNESQAQFSPDGRWIAYTSDETGSFQVYVQPFPPTGAKWQISNNGGIQPVWRNDGRELFFLNPAKTLMVVSIDLQPLFRAGNPIPLFETTVYRTDIGWNKQYAPSSDGRRFLMNTLSETGAATQMNIVLNWTGDAD